MAIYRQTGNQKFGKVTQRQDKSKTYLNSIKQKQQAQAKFVRMFVVFVIFVVAIIASVFYVGVNTDFCEKTFGKTSPITEFFDKMSSANSQHSSEFAMPFGHKRKNILLLGVDASNNDDDLWSGTRTDTIILMNIDPHTKSVAAISIPRDSKVYLPDGHGIQKINAAHAIGGVDMTIKTVEHTLGVKIDRYIMVHDNAVKSIVEALGGVDVYVEKNMRYHDYAGNLHIDLTKGYHHLNPTEAVGYLRFRHDPLGDIGRTHRQQWFLRGVLNNLKKPETISKIPDIVSVARKYVKTDMSLYELSQFAMMTKSLDMDKIEIATLPGGPNKHGSTSYWILDPDKAQEVVNRMVYRRTVPEEEMGEITASVVYTDDKSDSAREIIEQLKTSGINVSCQTTVSRTHSQFIAHSNKITNAYFNKLKTEDPSISGYQFVYEPTMYPCAQTDFTVVVAGNNK